MLRSRRFNRSSLLGTRGGGRILTRVSKMLIGQAVPVGSKVAVEFPDGMYVRIESERLLEEIRTVKRPVGVQSTELLGIVGSRKVIQARMTRETECASTMTPSSTSASLKRRT
jgi:hypothetical protein